MKKLFLILLTGVLSTGGYLASYTFALADLQCLTPPSYNSPLNVQNAQQCAGENGGILRDTSTGALTNPITGASVTLPNTSTQTTVQTQTAPNTVQNQPVTNGVNPNTFCVKGSCTYVPLEPLPGLPNSYGPQNSFASLIPSVFKLLIGAGALVAIIMIVLGALTYMFSDVITDKYKAKARIRNAMWGIVLLLSSYLILNTINPDLVTFKLNLGQNLNFSPTPAPQPAVTASGNAAATLPSNPTSGQVNDAFANCNRQYPATGGYVHYDGFNAICSPNPSIGSSPI